MNRHHRQHAEALCLLQRNPLRHQFPQHQVEKHQNQCQPVPGNPRTVGNVILRKPLCHIRRQSRRRGSTGVKAREGNCHLNGG